MENKHAWIIGICVIVAGMMIGNGVVTGSEDNPTPIELSDDGASIGVNIENSDTTLLDEDGLMSYLGIDEKEMKRLQKVGDLPSITIDGYMYYPKTGLDRWVEENTGKAF
ncbi:helix-turn-helix domain-containing protein [Listeria grandensis]|uniref:Helix-turn-helix domain-containing protein n=1 Tax=Listeria grandensis TaxID=1494963 RepID=A0A7X1CQ88_9LIST|nr:hypothetical protein [Listeria grandensis]MBC1475773.1 helix-turn-helix domain-containing protein [Listeria grandensis]MBC1936773.1 helix-turn-helix domain-containing protein [Listeria grandensis]